MPSFSFAGEENLMIIARQILRGKAKGEGKRGQTLNLNVSEGKTKFVVASGLVG